jgi:hypothetical protein
MGFKLQDLISSCKLPPLPLPEKREKVKKKTTTTTQLYKNGYNWLTHMLCF